MASIASAVRRVKDDPSRWLPTSDIKHICNDLNYTWRERTLGPVVTLWMFLEQIMAGNTACSALRHTCGVDITASAFCQARQRLPLALFKRLLRLTVHRTRDASRSVGLWLGHRTFHIDGSSFSMPDTPALQEHFGQPGRQKKGCGFPVAHLLALFDAGTGLLIDVIAAPLRTHDMAHASAMLQHLQPNDVLIADRGFCSFAHLALLFQHQMHAVFRIHQKTNVDFSPRRPHNVKGNKRKNKVGQPWSRWMKRLGMDDQIVEYFKPSKRPKWMDQDAYDALPESILVRELRYAVGRPGFRTEQVTLVTTLLDETTYTAESLAQLYGQRWQVEVNLRHLKQTLGLDVLKCKTVQGVMKELYVFALAYNLVRQVMCEASQRQQVHPDRISFIDALRWLRHASPGDDLPALIVNPTRPGRVEPRVIKRRKDRYPHMTKPRAQLKKRYYRSVIH